MSRVIKVDGAAIPTPNSRFKVSIEDISDEDSGRSLSGLMSKNIVATKRTIELSWSGIPDSKSSELLSTVKGNTYIDLTYPDPYTGTDLTKTFYTGTPSSELIVCVNDVCYWNISMNFIEQ